MRRTLWVTAEYLGLRIALGVLLVTTMIIVTRFGWLSPRYHLPMMLRSAIVTMIAALMTALSATFKRFTLAEFAVIFAIFTVVGWLLIPAVNGHTGEPASHNLLW